MIDEKLQTEIKKRQDFAKRRKLGKKCIKALARCKTIEEIDACIEMGKARKEAAMIAEDFGYNEKYIEQIWKADTEEQITRILITARRAAA